MGTNYEQKLTEFRIFANKKIKVDKMKKVLTSP